MVIDLSGVDNAILSDAAGLTGFISGLATGIDMHVMFGPVSQEGIPENPGVTAFAIIDYSHISIHTFTKHGEALVDIFSCKPYEQETAMAAVLAHFQATPEQARTQVVCWG